MSDNLEQLKARIDALFMNTKPTESGEPSVTRLIMDSFLDTWETCDKGKLITPDIFIDLLSVMEENMVMQYRDLEGLKAYALEKKSRAAGILNSINDMWPPVDPDKWPEKPPSWLEGGN